MHDITHTTSHQARLRTALHDEVADLHPQPALHEVLEEAHTRRWLCLWILAATVGLLLAALGLWMAAHHDPEPTSTIPSRLLEA